MPLQRRAVFAQSQFGADTGDRRLLHRPEKRAVAQRERTVDLRRIERTAGNGAAVDAASHLRPLRQQREEVRELDVIGAQRCLDRTRADGDAGSTEKKRDFRGEERLAARKVEFAVAHHNEAPVCVDFTVDARDRQVVALQRLQRQHIL